METYYLTKDDAQLASFWDRTAARGAFQADVKMREKLIGFFGAVFRSHPELLKSRIKGVPTTPGVQQDAIALILWWSDQEYSRRLLRDAGLVEMANLPVPAVSGRRILTEDDSDFLYGWYSATGDTAALAPLATHIQQADWAAAEEQTYYAGAMIAYFASRDLRAWEYFHDFTKGLTLKREAQQVFDKALEEKPEANPGSCDHAKP